MVPQDVPQLQLAAAAAEALPRTGGGAGLQQLVGRAQAGAGGAAAPGRREPHSKARFEIKHSPTRSCAFGPSRATVLDPTRHLPLRHDEAIRRRIALHCTTWASAESILAMLLPGVLMGGKRTHIHLTTYPLNTQGFVEARGHRPYAIATL